MLKRKNHVFWEQIATPVCGLARNDGLFRQPVSTRSVDGGIVVSGRGRAPPLHTSADSLRAIRAGGCGHPPLRNHRRRMRHTHGRTESSASTSIYRTCTLSLLCHSEERSDVGIRIPAPAGAEHPRGGLSKRIFRAPARGTFALGGKSTQKRRSNLRFENPLARLHPPRILTAFATRTLCPANFT